MVSAAVQLALAGTGVQAWASLSADKRYRYSLGRRWAEGALVLFVGLNPSTAEAAAGTDDQTCKKWRGFAERWGFGGYLAGNLFGLRSRDPAELVRRVRLGLSLECIGERNDPHLEHLANHPDVTLIVPCWGSSIPPELRFRVDDVVTLLRANDNGRPLKCLGVTKAGDPRHPLTLGYDTPLLAFGEVAVG